MKLMFDNLIPQTKITFQASKRTFNAIKLEN